MESHSEREIHLEAEALRVTVLPWLGGKIASLVFAGRELLQPRLIPYAPRTLTVPFAASDASGWDECLPSVAPCSMIGVRPGAETVSIPDHGDLWRVPWKQNSVSRDAATLSGECISLPLLLKRTIAISVTGKTRRLQLDYELANTGKSSVPWAWSAHPLFAVTAGDRILLPATIRKLRLEGSTTSRLGAVDSTIHWPITELPRGGTTDLSVVQPPGSGIGDKLFAGPLTPGEAWCALERVSAGVRIRIEFDAAATPYLGLWSCYGGWPTGPGPKQNCVALEPTTAPFDSLARTGPWSRILAAGESFCWRMAVDFDLLA